MRFRKTIAIFLCVISCLCLFISCDKGLYANDHRFLYEKMSEIPIEYEGYCLETCVWNDEMCVTKGQHIPSYEFTFRGVGILVQQVEGVYTISYNNSEVVIDKSFMEEKSSIYVNINQIWINKTDTLSSARIIGVGVFEEKIFIVTSSMTGGISKSIRGKCPNVLYYYDIDHDAVLYCGFYSGEMTAEGWYKGFTGGIDFKINKQN